MSKIRKSARGEACQIRIPSVCNGNPETTVFCHLGGAGMALKSSDLHGAYGCSSCHSAVDGHIKTGFSRDELKLMFYDGLARTQTIMLNKGLIKI